METGERAQRGVAQGPIAKDEDGCDLASSDEEATGHDRVPLLLLRVAFVPGLDGIAACRARVASSRVGGIACSRRCEHQRASIKCVDRSALRWVVLVLRLQSAGKQA